MPGHRRWATNDVARLKAMAKKYPTTQIAAQLGRGYSTAILIPRFLSVVHSAGLSGDGKNSPFVTALVKRMLTPQIEIRKLFDLVRDDVMEATGRQQQPFSYGSVPGNEDFYFLRARAPK